MPISVIRLVPKSWMSFFGEATNSSLTIYLHKVTLTEVVYDGLRSQPNKTAVQIIQDIKKLPIIIAQILSDEFVGLAAYFKVNHRISFADSFVLALAKLHNANIITSDHHEFDAVEQNGEVKFKWIR